MLKKSNKNAERIEESFVFIKFKNESSPFFREKRENYAFNFDVKHIFGFHKNFIKWFVCARALDFYFTTTFDGLVYEYSRSDCVRSVKYPHTQ